MNENKERKSEDKKQMRIPLTFKESEKWLYDEIRTHGDKANYVKDVLKQHLSDKQNSPSVSSSTNDDNFLDF